MVVKVGGSGGGGRKEKGGGGGGEAAVAIKGEGLQNLLPLDTANYLSTLLHQAP